jgi:hypothetical protein
MSPPSLTQEDRRLLLEPSDHRVKNLRFRERRPCAVGTSCDEAPCAEGRDGRLYPRHQQIGADRGDLPCVEGHD